MTSTMFCRNHAVRSGEADAANARDFADGSDNSANDFFPAGSL
jgi:hypothetical protein